MCLLRGACGCKAPCPRSGETDARKLLGSCRHPFLEDVPRAGRVDLDAWTHGRAERDRPQVAALGGRRLRADELVDQRGVVLEQLALVERHLADRKMDDR